MATNLLMCFEGERLRQLDEAEFCKANNSNLTIYLSDIQLQQHFCFYLTKTTLFCQRELYFNACNLSKAVFSFGICFALMFQIYFERWI